MNDYWYDTDTAPTKPNPNLLTEPLMCDQIRDIQRERECEYYESTGALVCHNLRNYPANGRDTGGDTEVCTHQRCTRVTQGH